MFNPFKLIGMLGDKKIAELETETKRVKAAGQLFESIAPGWEDNDEKTWELLGSAYKGNRGEDQRTMVAMARKLVRTDPNARAALQGALKYIVGWGVTITPKSQDPRVHYIWKDFSTSPRNRWQLRVRDIVKRWLRDGEFFLRFFTDVKEEGDDAAVKTWRSTVRFLDPMDVKRNVANRTVTETDKLNAGIETDPNDAEKVLKYHLVDRYDETKTSTVPADAVHHGKHNADMDQPRGDSFLLPIMKLFPAYEQWIKYRLVLNKVRTALVLIKKIEGNPSQVAEIRNSIPNSSRPTTGTSLKQQPKPGTVVTANAGVDYKMESANINAGDAAEDGRNIKLSMGAGSGMPEFMFGDASNSNYASSLISESPFVKEIQFHQSELEIHFKAIYRKVIKAAVDAGVIEEPAEPDVLSLLGKKRVLTEADEKKLADALPPATPKKDKNGEPIKDNQPAGPGKETELDIFYGCDLEWPEIVHRDPKVLAESLQIQRTNGWVDDKTCSETLGYDYDEVVRKQRQIELDAQEEDNPLLQMSMQGGDQYAQEAAAIFGDLSPEERKAIMDAQSPEEVAALLGGKSPTKVPGKKKPPTTEEA